MNQTLTAHRGTLILVLGVFSLVACPFLGIAPWIMGNRDLAEMNAGRMDPEGRGLTQGGRICGMVNVALSILGLFSAITGLIFMREMGALQG